MALTFRSAFEIGKQIAPAVSWVIRKVGKKSPRAQKIAKAVDDTANRNPKTLTATLTAAAVALLYWKFPDQAAAIVEWLTTHGPEILKGLTGAG